MKGCPFCVEFKEMLTKEGIEFFDRDIDEYKSEYDLFSEITNNDMIPALLKSFLYAPERNYNELTEAVDIIRKHQRKTGIIK